MTKARQLLFMVCCLFLAGGLLAQNPCENQPEADQEYTAVTAGIPTYAYTSIVDAANLILQADDGTANLSLEHPVVFYGAMATDIRVSSNGFFTTDLTAGSDLGNSCPTPNTGNPDGYFGVLHDDLDMGNNTPATEGVYAAYSMPSIYEHPADATMGSHVIQWIGDHWPADPQVDFQAIIFDNGDIVYLYNVVGEEGSGATTGWQETGAGPDAGVFNCDNAGGVVAGSVFAISAHGTDDLSDPVGACVMGPAGVEEVNLAAISEINVTLNENCRAMLISSQILTGDFDVDDNDTIPSEMAYTIVVEDNDPSNGAIIDGCGQFIWTVTADPEAITGFTSAWGYVNAEDKTSPEIIDLPETPSELFCNDIATININLLASNISRCWTQSGQSSATLNGSMSPALRARLLAGGGIPDFFDGCSNVEICVNDLISNNDPCDSTVITRVFTATDGDCPSVSGETNPATVVSYDIVFTRPSVDSVVGVDSLSTFNCDDNPLLLPPNAFGNANPAPTVQDFPFLELENGTPVYLSADGFCNIGATFQDGPRIVTCNNTYKFVRTFTVIDWCDVNNIRTFTQLVKVGDFEAPTLVGPTQDLDFDGNPDNGPLFYSTNTPDCEAIFAIPAGSATDNCDATPVVTAIIYPGADTTALGFGPYAVGQLTLAGNGGIPAGDHLIRYFATDDCGNISTLDVDLTIGDQTAPVAICEDGLNISIGGPIGATGGIAQLCAVDVNAASYDDCSDIDLTIRLTEINGVAVSPASPYFVFQACHTLTCDQLGDVEVELRVVDDANNDGLFQAGVDNSNFCWLDILVEDKTAPICISPAPVTVTCADLANDFPQDLNLEFASDPIGTAALLDAQFGNATGLDNCPDPVVTQTVFDNRNSCGVGTIQRTFTVTDAEGFVSPPSCAQLINVIGIHDYTVVFPGDQEDDDCVEPNYNGVTFTENGCDLITVSSSIDTFTATADECYKLRVNYEVLNWCEYNTIDAPYAIPRDADGDNILDMDITVLHVIPNGAGLNDDVAVLDRDDNRNNFNTIGNLDTGDGGVVPGSSVLGYGQDGSRGAFTYFQFIKVYDDTPPTLVVNEADPICSFDGVNCDADVELGFSITDECSPESVNAIVELDAFINAGADGIFTLAEFVADGGNVTDAVTNNGDGTFTINLPNIPIGRHALRIRATDGCGNTAIQLLVFEVIDCKAPTPICINGLTVTLMPDGNGGGMADIWVSDFIASPSTDCSGPVKFAIYTNDFVLDQGDEDFVPSVLDTGLVLTCDSDETTMIRIYAIDAMGQSDYCLTTLLVQENTPGICSPGGSFNELAGVIMTEAAGTVPGVNVAISGDMTASTMTNAAGVYNFSDLASGEDFTISPELDSYEYHLAGVSTFDLVLISKHILGIDELTSAYSLLAADANADQNVSVQDIIAVRRLILGLDLAYANSPAWMFVDAAFSFPVPVNPWATSFPEVYSINNINGNVLNADFVAVMVGNVDGNGMDNLTGSTEGRGGDNIVIEDMYLRTGVATSVKVNYNGGFQGTLGLAAGVEVVNVVAADANSTAFNLTQAASGLVAFSDMTGEGFELVLRSSSDVKLSEVLSVNNRITTTEGYPANAAVANLGLNFTTQEVAGFELLQNAPNPVADVTTVGFNLPVAADYSITVQDVTGKVVLRKASEGVAGYNTVVINRNELGATGVLTYTLVAGDFTATKKMVVVK